MLENRRTRNIVIQPGPTSVLQDAPDRYRIHRASSAGVILLKLQVSSTAIRMIGALSEMKHAKLRTAHNIKLSSR